MVRNILLALMFLCTNVFAAEQSVSEIPKMTGSIMHVVMNQGDSIAGLDGDKLYLKSQNIFQSKNGYLLRNQDSILFFLLLIQKALQLDCIDFHPTT